MNAYIRPGTAYRKPWEARRIRIDGARKQAIETGRNRVVVTAVVFGLAFAAIAGRLVDLTVLNQPGEPQVTQRAEKPSWTAERADIVDRNGVILATSLPSVSLYADPSEVLDPAAAADNLLTVLPDLDRDDAVARLSGDGRFVWLRRNLTPTQHYEINRLGIPGLQFQHGFRRVYPHGETAAHLLGLTDVDGRGIAGVERSFDESLREGTEPLRLSVDLRVQAILREELEKRRRGPG